MWAPKAMLMVPSAFTVSEWQEAQEAASAFPPMPGWPDGGIPWQEEQVIGAVSFHFTAAWLPETAPRVKAPWQATLLQVLVAGSKAAPAAWTAGFWEKSTPKPWGAWHPAQFIPGPKTPLRRCTVWLAPTGATTEAVPVPKSSWSCPFAWAASSSANRPGSKRR